MMPLFAKRGDRVVLPQHVTVATTELHPGRDWTPQENFRAPADFQAEESPRPVPYGEFAGHGKVDSERWVRQVLAIRDKLSIRASEVNGSAIMGKTEPGSVVITSYLGGQLPIRERTNITQPDQTTYGALATLRPDPTWAPQYAKIS
jgi:hypothetical protein